MIYLDNAATTFPKPPQVYDAANRFMRDIGASPGRSAHKGAVTAGRTVFDTRERLASFFNVKDSGRIVFACNATEALNLAILGTVKNGDRVAISSLEHNSVMRPLRFLAKSRGIVLDIVPCGTDGSHDLKRWEAALKQRPSMVVVNHGSNVTGSIAPVEEIGMLCRRYGSRFLVDAAQTAGLIPVDVEQCAADFLAFSGHKGLYGLQGTGGLYIREGADPVPLKFGGTGSNSESDDQPGFVPDRYESGTLNGPGLAALGAGVSFVMERGINNIFKHGHTLKEAFYAGIALLPGARVRGPRAHALPTVSLTIDGCDNGTAAQRLNDEYDIAVRVGLHCAPLAHRTIGTFPDGTIRVSFGCFNTEKEVSALCAALAVICGKK
jgi:cysteine desulfurase / selenocysteine lyase